MICLICTSCIRMDLLLLVRNEKRKENIVKKTIASVSLNGCQPSVSDTWTRTKQLSSCWREKTHHYGGRGRSEASVTERKDILIRLNAGFIKTLFKGDGCYDTVRSRGGGGQQGWRCPSVVATSTCSASKQQLPVLTVFMHGNPVLFLVNSLSASAKCSLLWCFCTSPPGGHLSITEHREVCDTLNEV